jgi:hypothetical protein
LPLLKNDGRALRVDSSNDLPMIDCHHRRPGGAGRSPANSAWGAATAGRSALRWATNPRCGRELITVVAALQVPKDNPLFNAGAAYRRQRI